MKRWFVKEISTQIKTEKSREKECVGSQYFTRVQEGQDKEQMFNSSWDQISLTLHILLSVTWLLSNIQHGLNKSNWGIDKT